MVSKIGGASLAQSLMARVESAKAQESAAVAVTTASSDEAATGTASVRSAQTEASERVGEQLDASRLQGAQGEASAAPAAAGGVHIGGGAASSSESAATDYLAEADTKGKPTPVTRPSELLDAVLAAGRKGLSIQRYKGLGEMNAEQLWETTLDPEARTLLQVKIREADDADDLFGRLMGDVVEPRREFIQENALNVANLDV